MNINDFFKNKPQWKRTTRYKNNVELTTKPYVNELVYSFGQIYLYLGLLDDFDDIYYIKVGIDGIIHYESCVGTIGVPIKDMIHDDEQYKKIKNSFIKNIKRQCEWRKSWDKRVYLPENTDTMQVEYFKQDGIPFIKELKKNIKQAYAYHLYDDERKRIRKRFWNYFWHMFGFHHISHREWVYDEVQAEKDNNETYNYDAIYTGTCDVCKHTFEIKPGWIWTKQFWYKKQWKWLTFICKPFITFLDMYKRVR